MKLKITKEFERKARSSALAHEPSLFKEGKLNKHIWRDGYTDGYIRGYLEAKSELIPTTIEMVAAEEKLQESDSKKQNDRNDAVLYYRSNMYDKGLEIIQQGGHILDGDLVWTGTKFQNAKELNVIGHLVSDYVLVIGENYNHQNSYESRRKTKISNRSKRNLDDDF